MSRTHDTAVLEREIDGERRWRPGLSASDEREDKSDDDGWRCPRCMKQVQRDFRGRICPHCGWYEG